LSKNRGRINESARQAGISTRQLHKLMSRYCIKKEAFK
jgi:DNA-binding NtrC family response regulator